MQLKPWKIDIPVLLIFFIRADTLEKVFESIRQARPRRLLLWQDGPRGTDDMEKMKKCREIVDQIDWDCEVYKNYHDKNMGCDPSTFLAQKWAFTIVDKCIILEDDRIPSQSFYGFCAELLTRYENDTRINHICGTNIFGENQQCDSDYFFAPFGSTTWATWKRVADEWDEYYNFLNDNEYFLNCLKNCLGKSLFNSVYQTAVRHQKTGIQYWETILGMTCMLNNRLAIIPKKNMICDIGMTRDSTHANADVKLLDKETIRMFNMDASEIRFPIIHPRYVLPDMNYVKQIMRVNCIGRPVRRMMHKINYAVKCIIYGDGRKVMQHMKKKIDFKFKRGGGNFKQQNKRLH